MFRRDLFFRRECNTPEQGRACREFNADLRFLAGNTSHVHHFAGYLFTRHPVRQPKRLSFCNFRNETDQASMRVHDKGLRFFLKSFVWRPAFAADYDCNGEHYTLAAPAVGFKSGRGWVPCRHVTSTLWQQPGSGKAKTGSMNSNSKL